VEFSGQYVRGIFLSSSNGTMLPFGTRRAVANLNREQYAGTDDWHSILFKSPKDNQACCAQQYADMTCSMVPDRRRGTKQISHEESGGKNGC